MFFEGRTFLWAPSSQWYGRVRDELAQHEADAALSEGGGDDEIRSMRAADQTRSSLSFAEREIDDFQRNLAALEAAAPAIDEAVTQAGVELNREIQMFGDNYRASIAAELCVLVAPLLSALVRTRAVGLGLFDVSFTDDACLGDPETFISLGRDNHLDYLGANLTDCRNASGAPDDPLVQALKPVRAALSALRRHRAYVPIAQRQQPYALRGCNEGPGGRPPPPLQQTAPLPPMSPDKALKVPYEIKGDSSGLRGALARRCNPVDFLKAASERPKRRRHRTARSPLRSAKRVRSTSCGAASMGAWVFPGIPLSWTAASHVPPCRAARAWTTESGTRARRVRNAHCDSAGT